MTLVIAQIINDSIKWLSIIWRHLVLHGYGMLFEFRSICANLVVHGKSNKINDENVAVTLSNIVAEVPMNRGLFDLFTKKGLKNVSWSWRMSGRKLTPCFAHKWASSIVTLQSIPPNDNSTNALQKLLFYRKSSYSSPWIGVKRKGRWLPLYFCWVFEGVQ